MKLTENLLSQGTLTAYDMTSDIELLEKNNQFDRKKPSAWILSKKGRKIAKALEMIKQKHNHSWAAEVRNTAARMPDAIAIDYRGNRIKYNELFETADKLARALLEVGVTKDDEIIALFDNTPELIYTMLAVNMIGASINLLGEKLEPDYLSDIMDDCSKKVLFSTDRLYPIIKNVADEKNFGIKILCSLSRSLPHEPEKCEGYLDRLDTYYRYGDKVSVFGKDDPTILSFDEFVNKYGNTDRIIADDNDLNTHFLTTYSSGSTIKGRPKQIMHANRSLIVMGIFHNPELAGNPPTPGLRALAYIHPESNTDIIPSISDPLIQGWTVVPEPEYSKETFLKILYLDRPNYANATTSFWIQAAKDYFYEQYNDIGCGNKMPWLFTGLTAGEPCERGAEKYINRWLKQAKAGNGYGVKGFHFPWAPLGGGGGDCEHGALCYTLWTKFVELFDRMRFRKKYTSIGLKPVPYCTATSFKLGNDGKYHECDYDEVGLLAINSCTSYMGYKNNTEAVRASIITDELGREWHSCNVYGFVDRYRRVHMLDRYGSVIRTGTNKLPKYILEQAIQADADTILSCTLTIVPDEKNNDIPVVNYEMVPGCQLSEQEIMCKMLHSLRENNIPEEVLEKVRFRLFGDGIKDIPLRPSGKRAFNDIAEMGLEGTVIWQNVTDTSCSDRH